MKQEIRLPTIKEQQRIVGRIDSLVSKIEEARGLAGKSSLLTNQLARSRFSSIIAGAPCKRMLEVAPLVRRKVEPRLGEEYAELGIRSFGRGSFHKPSLDYLSVGTKKLYRIEPGDLVFNNVFAWEGAIAVAKPEDKGRVGSHRFIRTLGIEKLTDIEVPVPEYRYQLHFGRLLRKVQEMQEARELNSAKLSAMLPSILESAFKGAL